MKRCFFSKQFFIHFSSRILMKHAHIEYSSFFLMILFFFWCWTFFLAKSLNSKHTHTLHLTWFELNWWINKWKKKYFHSFICNSTKDLAHTHTHTDKQFSIDLSPWWEIHVFFSSQRFPLFFFASCNDSLFPLFSITLMLIC